MMTKLHGENMSSHSFVMPVLEHALESTKTQGPWVIPGQRYVNHRHPELYPHPLNWLSTPVPMGTGMTKTQVTSLGALVTHTVTVILELLPINSSTHHKSFGFTEFSVTY